jgi:4-alpha-glucanotransferase
LHLQLTAAIDYIHSKGLAIKGDLPIGIYRHSVEAWTEPELFGMDFRQELHRMNFRSGTKLGISNL